MLKVSKLTDYSTSLLVQMCREEKDLFNAKDLAAKLNLSLPTVSKLLKILAKKGVLVSERGIHGGYRLARSASEINLLTIISAVDGGFGVTECALQQSHCVVEGHCLTKHNWQFISRTIYDMLANITLAEMAMTQLNSHILQIKKQTVDQPQRV